MSIALVLGGLIAFVAPALLYVFYFSGKKDLYWGPATCRSYTKSVFEHSRRYGLVFVDVPGHGEILAEISYARAQALSAYTDPVTVKVVKRPFKRAEIESIAFADAAPEPAAPSYEGLGLSLYFFALAAAALLWLPSHTASGALCQHIALYFSALCFAATGYSVNALAARDNKNDLRQSKANFLFIPLGSGYAGLYAMWLLALAITVASFWTFGIFILLPGIHAAFALGSIPGVLWRNRDNDHGEIPAGPTVK